jgi:hypothetical protein
MMFLYPITVLSYPQVLMKQAQTKQVLMIQQNWFQWYPILLLAMTLLITAGTNNSRHLTVNAAKQFAYIVYFPSKQ